MGKLFLILSVVFFAMWMITTYGSHHPLLGRLGHLPGDIHIRKDTFSFHFPVVSSVVASVLLTILLSLLKRL